MLRSKLTLSIAILLNALVGSAFAAVTFDTIALTGSSGTTLGFGPGLGAGVDFASFDNAFLNSNGDVAFVGTVAGTGVVASNDTGIWSRVGGPLTVIAREGVGGTNPNLGAGVYLSVIHPNPVLDANGKITYSGNLAGTGIDSSNQYGIWTTAAGLTVTNARSGTDSEPNLGPGVSFESFSVSGSPFYYARPIVNASGHLAFFARLTGTGVNPSNNEGIWSNASGSLTPTVRTGSEGPGLNGGATAYFTQVREPVLNADGKIAFYGALAGTAVNTSNDTGIWTKSGGNLVTVAREGSDGPGPNLGAGVTFSSSFNLRTGFTNIALNDVGNVAFYGFVAGPGITLANDTGIWSDVGGSLTVVAREGADGPTPNLGSDIYFGQFDYRASLDFNAAGEIAFKGALTGTLVNSSNNTGIWSNAAGVLTPIARTGSDGPGPNLGPGIYFGDLSNPALNSQGDVAFLALLFGNGINSSNDVGLWVNAGGTLQKIVRDGDLFDVDPGINADLRTISSITILDPALESAERFFNDSGMLAFELRFTDGSRGIFTAIVPEPNCAALIFCGAGLLILSRRFRVKRI